MSSTGCMTSVQSECLHRKYILMRYVFLRHELMNVLCSWYGRVSSRRSLAVLLWRKRRKLEKTMSGEDDRSTKHSAPVDLGISDLDPLSLTLTCLPNPSLVSTTSKGVGVGSISARKRISRCKARCFRMSTRDINNKMSANTATAPPTIGPSRDCRGDRNLEDDIGLETTRGKVALPPWGYFTLGFCF